MPPSRRIARLPQLVSLLESSTHNLLFVPIATRCCSSPSARGRDRSLARAPRPRGRRLAARSASSKRCRRSPRTRSSIRAIRFPHIVDAARCSTPTRSAHPLMPDGVSVRERRQARRRRTRTVIVVSGSNMSGKSTLLRAVGINVVLALAGAPVRAAALQLSPLAIGATLRIEDSLQEGHSRFYAEILRIRGIVERRARAGAAAVPARRNPARHQFARSADRRRGDRARAGRAGRDRPGDDARPGADRAAGRRLDGAANMHFEDRLENGRMVFDYRMRPGVVEHSNALALMRAIGLDV